MRRYITPYSWYSCFIHRLLSPSRLVAFHNPPKRPATTTTTTAWGGTCEIITLKSGDRRRRNELADRAKRLRILRKYGLARPDTATSKCGKSDAAGRGGGDDYDGDGFEGEVCVCGVWGMT